MVSEGVILGLLTLASGAIGAGLAWLTGRRADKTNRRKNESEHLQGREQLLWENVEQRLGDLKAQVEAQAKQITELRDGRKADQKELESVRMDLRATRDAMRDYEELLADYREHTYAYQVWTDDGGVPPSPVWSWRIAADQRDYAKEKGVK